MKIVIDTNVVVSAVLRNRNPETVILFVIGDPEFEWRGMGYFSERNQAFLENHKRAGMKIWGEEVVKAVFKDSNNCKDPKCR